ncbi:MAG TPA: hypothetical protein VNY33_02540 [Gaiellaceae bacterium]|nr:hypothetical protein [Gaiellaceae bacterium]
MSAIPAAAAPILLAATLAGVLAGCGGGGRLSHGDFVQRADAVCLAFRAAAGSTARPSTYDEIVTYVNKTLPLYEAARLKLVALKPPASDAATVRDWLAADQRIATALHDLGEAALRRDFTAVSTAAATVQSEGVTSRRAAAALGTKVCSQA